MWQIIYKRIEYMPWSINFKCWVNPKRENNSIASAWKLHASCINPLRKTMEITDRWHNVIWSCYNIVQWLISAHQPLDKWMLLWISPPPPPPPPPPPTPPPPPPPPPHPTHPHTHPNRNRLHVLNKGFIWHWQHTYKRYSVRRRQTLPPECGPWGALENIVHGDGISMTSVAGPVGGLPIWPGAIPDRPPADRPQIDDSLTGTKLKWYNYFPQTINGLLSIDNSSFTD